MSSTLCGKSCRRGCRPGKEKLDVEISMWTYGDLSMFVTLGDAKRSKFAVASVSKPVKHHSKAFTSTTVSSTKSGHPGPGSCNSRLGLGFRV